MIFADKLIALRKKAGYSQEELAQQLNVTRQSVSKWEGAQSVPDIDKILQLSCLFGVTTDYLLKDEQAEPEYTEDDTSPLPRVTLAQANDYLAKARANAPKLALAAALCVVSPIPLLALGGKGVISVLSNVAPQYTHDVCAKWFAGDFDESLAMQLKALPLIKALFADVNPIPVKWAMNRLGWNAGPLRLPLVESSAAVQQSLENEMKVYGVLK